MLASYDVFIFSFCKTYMIIPSKNQIIIIGRMQSHVSKCISTVAAGKVNVECEGAMPPPFPTPMSEPKFNNVLTLKLK